MHRNAQHAGPNLRRKLRNPNRSQPPGLAAGPDEEGAVSGVGVEATAVEVPDGGPGANENPVPNACAHTRPSRKVHALSRRTAASDMNEMTR